MSAAQSERLFLSTEPLSVVEWPAAVLETVASPVEVFDSHLQAFAVSMHRTMDTAGGIGLAANQVGVLKRVITIHIPYITPSHDDPNPFEEKAEWHDKRYTFVNPKIISKSGKINYMEGCLSFPEVFDYVDRARDIVLEYQDVEGKVHTLSAGGLMSICLQHEVDHLDGIVFMKRMSRLKSMAIRKKMMKRAQNRIT